MRIASAIAFAGLVAAGTIAAAPAHFNRPTPPQVRLTNLVGGDPASLAVNDSTLFRAVPPETSTLYQSAPATGPANFTVTVTGPDSATASSTATLEQNRKYTVKASRDSDHRLKIVVVKDNG